MGALDSMYDGRMLFSGVPTSRGSRRRQLAGGLTLLQEHQYLPHCPKPGNLPDAMAAARVVFVMRVRGATRDTAAFRGPIMGQSKRRRCALRVLNDVRYGGVIGQTIDRKSCLRRAE
jgi:hypothetical protein